MSQPEKLWMLSSRSFIKNVYVNASHYTKYYVFGAWFVTWVKETRSSFDTILQQILDRKFARNSFISWIEQNSGKEFAWNLFEWMKLWISLCNPTNMCIMSSIAVWNNIISHQVYFIIFQDNKILYNFIGASNIIKLCKYFYCNWFLIYSIFLALFFTTKKVLFKWTEKI